MLVYFTLTQNVKRFVDKITPTPETLRIDPMQAEVEMSEPFILVVPTYEEEITAPVFDFLDTGMNAELCRGVFGSGNRNFAGLYCFTAHDLSEEYGFPVLGTFEFQGEPGDVLKIEEELARIHEEN